jgi:cytochrome oxidase Cu insertion factor (SCO1/SenC/PrrC family)
MKKVLLLLLALTLGLGLKAQCPLTTAVDFTATDCHGTEVHLFDILDGGQYVLIDFFFTTCGPCQQATPKIVESYYAFGCNMHDVFYMEISVSDGDAACQNWATNYGVEYPTIGTNGGGNGICNQYGIGQYPTIILIAPDHSIVIQDLWPINNAQTVITALENHGVQQHDCTPGGETIVDFTGTDLEGNEVNLYSLLDNGQAVLINFFLYGDEYSEAVMSDMVEAYRLYGCNEHDVFFMEISPNGYDNQCQAWVEEFGVQYPTISRDGGGNDIAQAIPVGYYPTIMLIRPDHTFANRDIYPPTLEYIVNAMDAEGYEQHECPVVYDETLTFSTDTINVNWMELTWITIYNNTAQDAVVDTIISYFLNYTLDGTTFFSTLRPMEFTIPQGESIELGLYCDAVSKGVYWDVVTLTGDFPDASFVAGVDLPWSVEESPASFTVFPNPANDRVTLKGSIHGTVSVFNTLGQQVETIEATGTDLNINTSNYLNGVYFIKANEKTLRFVITH